MYFVLCGKWCTESWMRHPMAERVPLLGCPRRLMLYEYEVGSTTVPAPRMHSVGSDIGNSARSGPPHSCSCYTSTRHAP